jgi:predicted nucleotide-binding protein (sugar kinase/HSP70/actin superfamily)
MIHGLETDYVIPPPMSKRTLELGVKYSPDYVCAPFKINLGSYLEAIERGANVLIQTGGICRLGYYGELHEQILRDLGHNIDFVNMSRASYARPQTFIREFKKINPALSLRKALSALLAAVEMVKNMDEIDDYMRRSIGFQREEGAFEGLYDEYLRILSQIKSQKEIKSAGEKYIALFKAIPLLKPQNPLRVGVVGEYYSIMDSFSNHYIEKEMAKMGVEVERWMNISHTLFHYPEKQILARIKNYAKYPLGATGTSTIERALTFAQRGYDGIIHLKAFGCTPETDTMPALQNISSDYKIPILYFSFDSQTSDTGIQTRLEAFYDMMIMRKGARKQ